jgi:hypothetical protein
MTLLAQQMLFRKFAGVRNQDAVAVGARSCRSDAAMRSMRLVTKFAVDVSMQILRAHGARDQYFGRWFASMRGFTVAATALRRGQPRIVGLWQHEVVAGQTLGFRAFGKAVLLGVEFRAGMAVGTSRRSGLLPVGRGSVARQAIDGANPCWMRLVSRRGGDARPVPIPLVVAIGASRAGDSSVSLRHFRSHQARAD